MSIERSKASKSRSAISRSSSSRDLTFPGLLASESSRSNSVGVSERIWPRKVAECCAGSRRKSPTENGGLLLAPRECRRYKRPPYDSAQSGKQFARRKRFRDVIVGPEFESGNPVRRFPARGQHDHRHGRGGANPLQYLEPVQSREHDVKEDGMELLLARLLQTVGTRVGERDIIAERFQVLLDHSAQLWIVIDE